MAKGCCARTSDVSGPILGIPILLRSETLRDSRVKILNFAEQNLIYDPIFLGGCGIELLV